MPQSNFEYIKISCNPNNSDWGKNFMDIFIYILSDMWVKKGLKMAK